jgi:tRNA(fMet)-specific endonuclease VapC
MASKSRVVVDSCVFIEVWRSNRAQSELLNRTLFELGVDGRICITPIVRAELVLGARTKEELKQIHLYIDDLPSLPLTELAMLFFDTWADQFALSHQPAVPDLLIAATAVAHDASLLTLNTKDFMYLPGVALEQVQ